MLCLYKGIFELLVKSANVDQVERQVFANVPPLNTVIQSYQHARLRINLHISVNERTKIHFSNERFYMFADDVFLPHSLTS